MRARVEAAIWADERARAPPIRIRHVSTNDAFVPIHLRARPPRARCSRRSPRAAARGARPTALLRRARRPPLAMQVVVVGGAVSRS